MKKELPISSIDRSWSLFLDRDGIINERIIDGYVQNPAQFVLLPYVREAFVELRQRFGHIFLVTNQQGIGKGLMSEQDLEQVHGYMEAELEFPFDRIYFCPELASANSPFRKPEIGMALQAQRDFPDVDFSRSVMVGDAVSDMLFGEKAGMFTVFIPGAAASWPDAGMQCESLYDFAQRLKKRTR